MFTNRDAIRNIPVPKGAPLKPRLRQSKQGDESCSAQGKVVWAQRWNKIRFLKIPKQLKQAACHGLAYIFVLVHFLYPFEGFSSPD